MRATLYEQEPQDSTIIDDLEGFASRVLGLNHPTILGVIDVLKEPATSRWALLIPQLDRWLALEEVVRVRPSVATACSIAASLAEAFAYLHQVRFRGAESFDWSDMVRSAVDESGSLGLSVLPPNPKQIQLVPRAGCWGNPRFMAPELFVAKQGAPTPMSDSFSIGAVLFQLVTSEPLVKARDMMAAIAEVREGQFRRATDVNPVVDHRLSEFIARATDRNPQARPTLREWSFVMEQFGGSPLPPIGPGPIETTHARRERDLPSRSNWVSVLSEPHAGLEMTGAIPIVHGGMASEAVVDFSYQPSPSAGVAVPPELENRPKRQDDARTDPVDCSIFGREQTYVGDTALLHVFLHTPQQLARARQLAKELDDEAHRLGWQSLEIDIPRGTSIQLHMSVPGLTVDDPVLSVIWHGRPTSVEFGLTVPKNIGARSVIGKVDVYRDALPIGHIKFRLTIATFDDAVTLPEPQPLGLQASRYRLAFISYASKDRHEVLKRVQMLDRLQVRYFQDLLSLEPGARWEKEIYRHIDECDVFLLFWSSNAKASEWVAKELDYALARQGGNELSPPEIVPVIIEGPPAPPPPEQLRHLHFDDRLIHFSPR